MKKTIMALILSFITVIPVYAGTVGMSGLWSFEGQLTTTDPAGNIVGSDSVIGEFDFDAGMVNLELDSPFFGLTWYTAGTIEDRLDGTYWGSLVFFWSSSTYNWNILWDITLEGNTATVITLDGDGDGIPGISLLDGPYVDYSHVINGTLTTVPVPAAVWLFGSGLIGLTGLSKRKAA